MKQRRDGRLNAKKKKATGQHITHTQSEDQTVDSESDDEEEEQQVIINWALEWWRKPGAPIVTLEFIGNSNILGFSVRSNIPNKLEPNRPLFGSCSSRTELLGTCDCSVRNEHEPNRGSVRFGSFRTMTLFGSASNRTNRTNSNLHCSASQLWFG
jgi:hypothetical protein